MIYERKALRRGVCETASVRRARAPPAAQRITLFVAIRRSRRQSRGICVTAGRDSAPTMCMCRVTLITSIFESIYDISTSAKPNVGPKGKFDERGYFHTTENLAMLMCRVPGFKVNLGSFTPRPGRLGVFPQPVLATKPKIVHLLIPTTIRRSCKSECDKAYKSPGCTYYSTYPTVESEAYSSTQ